MKTVRSAVISFAALSVLTSAAYAQNEQRQSSDPRVAPTFRRLTEKEMTDKLNTEGSPEQLAVKALVEQEHAAEKQRQERQAQVQSSGNSISSELSTQPARESIIRVIPRDDYAHLPKNFCELSKKIPGHKIVNDNPIGHELCKIFGGLYSFANDEINRTKPLANLQWNIHMGGDDDLVYQLSQDHSRLEVFVCPTMRKCVDAADANHANQTNQEVAASCAAGSAANLQAYWSCEQVYSMKLTDGGQQATADYNYDRRKRIVLDFIFNNIVGSATVGQVKVITTGIPGILSQILGIAGDLNTVYDFVHNNAKTDGIPTARESLTVLNPDNKIEFMREKSKYGLVSQQAIWRTRNRRGERVDQMEKEPPMTDEEQLSLGDRYRKVQMDPSHIQDGRIPYTVKSGLNVRPHITNNTEVHGNG